MRWPPRTARKLEFGTTFRLRSRNCNTFHLCSAAWLIQREPLNMFEFFRPVVEACDQPWPRLRVPGRLVWFVMTAWQWFHFPVQTAQTAAGTACRGTAFPRQLLLDRQGTARSRTPTVVHHEAGDGRLSSVLRRPFRPDEGRDHFGTRRQRDHRGAGRRLRSVGTELKYALFKQVGAARHSAGGLEAGRYLLRTVCHRHGFSHLRAQPWCRQFLGH
jgi:hypothetical protein